jgi:hypothetical protein
MSCTQLADLVRTDSVAALRLAVIEIDAEDPAAVAGFWAGILGWEPHGAITLLPLDDTGFAIRFLPGAAQKAGQNQIDFDLTSATRSQQDAPRAVRRRRTARSRRQ